MNKQKSFTLIELLVVIVIIGILAGVIMISTSSSIDKANIAKVKVFEESVQNNLAIKTSLIIDFDPKKQRLNPEIQKEIDGCFKSKINCFDGALIHVKKIEIGKKIRFSTQIGSYKDFIGTQHRRPNSIGKIHGRQDYCMPLSIGAIVITKNNKIIVAKRKKTNLNANYWSFPAEGYLDPNKHLINNEISVFNGIAAELKEELGIHINEVKTFHILGIVYDKEITKQPYIATIWKTNLKTFDIKNLSRTLSP
jgi:prepilin-type N-terminal cleavage/methylation domain-containing protein